MVLRGIALVSMLAMAAPAAAEIGRIKVSSGTANIQRGTATMAAASGTNLEPGDWLETGKDGRMSLTFIDNTRFSVGPDSRIALTKFDYDPTAEKGSFIAEVERGSIAVVSGRITKTRCGASPQPNCGAGMEIRTPDAVLDVRGTRFILVVKK